MLHGDVRRTIRLLLPARRCSRADVAKRLGIHPRTLGRRLQESGTTFQALLDDTRAQMAKQLLLRHALDGRAYRGCGGVRGSDGVHPGLRSLDGPHTKRVPRGAGAAFLTPPMLCTILLMAAYARPSCR